MNTNEHAEAVFDSRLAAGHEERRTVPLDQVRQELDMSADIIRRLRLNYGLKFRKVGGRYFYNIAEVAWAYLNAPTFWKLNSVKHACEKFLEKRMKSREQSREWRRKRAAERNPEAADGKKLDVVDAADARCDAVTAWALNVDPKTMTADWVPNADPERAGTQLALQDAEDALARTREERDALKAENKLLKYENTRLAAENAELRGQATNAALSRAAERDGWRRKLDDLERKLADLITKNAELARAEERARNEALWFKGAAKQSDLTAEALEMTDGSSGAAAQIAELREQLAELQHEKHLAQLQMKALATDAALWKQTAEAVTKMNMDAEAEIRALKAKVNGGEA